MGNLVSKRYLWFALSLIMIVPGLISLLFTGLRLGLDFTGGTQVQLQFQDTTTSAAVNSAIADAGYANPVVQSIAIEGGDSYQIRLPEIQEGSEAKAALYAGIEQQVGPFTELSFSTIGAAVSDELRRNSFIAIAVASVGILLYMALAFRNTRNPWLYGSCAIATMLHDVLIIVGIFSILGWAAGVEVDTLFVTAILTIIGFSVHDTIVVFDRIRENLARRIAPTFEATVNYSIAQTIVRSVNTSVSTVFVLLALYMFGGASTRNFVLALLLGIIIATYSSIFNAAQLMVAWDNGEIQGLFRRFRGGGGRTAAAPSR